MTWRDIACPLCGALAGERCLNLRLQRAFNPNRLLDHYETTTKRPHPIRTERGKKVKGVRTR